MKSGSNLEKIITSGQMAVTAELGPPMSADPHEIIEKTKLLKGFCDAANITDCQTAVVRISSIAAAYIAQQHGLEPVMQMTCRDRNRIAMQADLLGAAALGLKNCLCIAGDHQKFGAAGKLKGHPGAKNVYDVDTCQLVSILKKMRDQGLQQGGDKIEVPPKFFIGASWTPMGDPMDFRPYNLMKKVDAGADFIQTQGIYDMELFRQQMEKARNLGLHERTAILAGIIVPKSGMMLRYMDSSVAGVTVPKPLIERMLKAKEAAGDDRKKAKELQEQEGIRITVELVKQALEVPGIKGVHIQAIEWESAIEEIVKAAGLYPRPNL
ncbi:MAG: methylenetetrahydrofolate reductase [Dissulfurispiraceae bacterium]|jgi:methylenetetrahydrofolate reductase (NADPH)|nr:methylenetetrahydrofolate reductase [Dissulfurispiraceae bacterium]